ncbi:MAG: hypothetical protein ACR2M6_02420 [Vampirovibrionia bacterium]
MRANMKLKLILPKPMIQRKICGIGAELNEESDINLIIVGRSSFIFASEIYSKIQNRVDTISILEPYYTDEGKIEFVGGITTDLTNKKCFVIHAVCDTGFVHSQLVELLKSEFTSCRIKNICMINKLKNRQFEYHTDYSVLEVKDQDIFFVGYGIALDEEHRDLLGIYKVY